ncbi:MAG: hypothetical protein NVSMB38_40350 [Ktedonobacteraceae bacterium]
MPTILEEWLGYAKFVEVVKKTGEKKQHNKWWAACLIQDDDQSYRVHTLRAGLGQKTSEHIERYNKQGKPLTRGEAYQHYHTLVKEKQTPRHGYVQTPFDMPFGTPLRVMVPSFTHAFSTSASLPSSPLQPSGHAPATHAAQTIICANCGAATLISEEFCDGCGMEIAASSKANSAGSVSSTVRIALAAPSTLSHFPIGPLQNGTLLKNGRYTIREKVGAGGMGAVYKAEDGDFAHRQVAIKELVPDQRLTTQQVINAHESFRREAFLLAPLSHQSLPRIFDSFQERDRSYLVMDFLEGKTLEQLLEDVAPGRLAVRQVVEIGVALCDVLDYLHTRQPPLIFRDVKPSNVMITPRDHLYMIDFGIARAYKFGQQKDTTALGSPGYAAPEQYGKGQSVPRTDIYGLGATLHHLLTGDDPSDTPFSFGKFPPGIAEAVALETLVLGMVKMQVNERRPVNAAKVKTELLKIAARL